MKAPSKNMSTSLRGQRAPGRTPSSVEVSALRPFSPSMIAPGEGGVSNPPGAVHPSSTKKYADAAGKKVGG